MMEFVNGKDDIPIYEMENKTMFETNQIIVCDPFLAKSLAALLTGGGHRPRTLRRGLDVLCEAGHRNAGHPT